MRIAHILFLVLVGCHSKEPGKTPGVTKDFFAAISENDLKLAEPSPGDWRYTYHEKHQSFEDYKILKPLKAELGKTILYLQPIGKFSPAQISIIESTREYLQIFFQLTTVTLDAVPDETIPDSAKRTRANKSIQLYTPYIMDKILKGKIPVNGYALMAISEKDLYPAPNWNFVFGIASYKDRIGVSSMWRLQDAGLDNSGYVLCLRRLATIASHEIGHMFSIHHCVFAQCAMNGSNNLPETDACLSRLCSECQQKLHWNIQYDHRKRLRELIGYFRKNKLSADLVFAERDYKLIQ